MKSEPLCKETHLDAAGSLSCRVKEPSGVGFLLNAAAGERNGEHLPTHGLVLERILYESGPARQTWPKPMLFWSALVSLHLRSRRSVFSISRRHGASDGTGPIRQNFRNLEPFCRRKRSGTIA